MANNPYLDMTLPRGFRNLNPGNIEDGPFARRQPGYSGGDGRFARFDNMEHGLDAQSALLQSYGNKGLNTLNAIVNRYAPASDHNNTAAYAGFLSKRLGIAPDAPLDMSNPSVRRDLAMAMAQHENGKDPRGFLALASDNTPQVGGEQPQAPQGAQSISLGDQENQQPLNNIGSTLANMGASLASLDRGGTGIASLNASRVASNLASQEQAREAQGGWKYAGQTQNGQGLMFQNSRGEIRVEPLAPGFAGQKEPETIRTLRMLQADPSLMETMKEKSGSTSETPPLTEDDYSRFLDKEVAGGKLGTPEFGTGKDSNANRINYQHYKTENLKKFGLTEDDLAKAATNNQFRGRVARDLGGTEFKFTTSYNNFMAGSQVLEEYAKEYPREWPKIVEAARQGAVLGLNIPGIGAEQLAKLDTAFDTTAIEYAKAKNPANSNLTISEQNEAKTKFRSTMSNEELFGRLGAMRRELDANKERMVKLHDSVIGSHVASPLTSATSAEPAQSGGKGKPTIGGTTKAPANIRNRNELMNWIQSQGLQKGDKFTLPDGTEGIVP